MKKVYLALLAALIIATFVLAATCGSPTPEDDACEGAVGVGYCP